MSACSKVTNCIDETYDSVPVTESAEIIGSEEIGRTEFRFSFLRDLLTEKRNETSISSQISLASTTEKCTYDGLVTTEHWHSDNVVQFELETWSLTFHSFENRRTVMF